MILKRRKNYAIWNYLRNRLRISAVASRILGQKWVDTGLYCKYCTVYGNIKSENSQDYAQKPQRNFTFMNSTSEEVPIICNRQCVLFIYVSTRLKLCIVVCCPKFHFHCFLSPIHTGFLHWFYLSSKISFDFMDSVFFKSCIFFYTSVGQCSGSGSGSFYHQAK